MEASLIGLIGLLVLVIFLFSGMPVGFAIFFIGFLGFGYLASWQAAIGIMAKDFFNTYSWYILSVIPMFIFMGFLAYETGVSQKLFSAAYAWVGHIRGGLAMAAIVASTAFGAICGDPCATAATMGAVTYPSFKKYKYHPMLSTSSVAAGGLLGILIPPSIIFIIYGIITENSIGALFLAGILPGIMTMLLFMGTIYLLTLRNPKLGPPGSRVSFKEKLSTLRGGTIETLIIFTVVIGGLVIGFFTPTECGAVGATGIILIGLATRQLKWKGFVKALSDTVRTSAFIFVILAAVLIFGRFLAVSGLTNWLGVWTAGLPLPPWAIMISVLFIYFLFGMVIDPLPFMILTIGVFYPLAISLGYDPIWFGVIMVYCCGMGGITPPVGTMVYVMAGVTDVPLMTIFRGVWPFVGAIIVSIALLLIFPEIATWLPNHIIPLKEFYFPGLAGG